ncbi:MAG: F0F1 ATP synthase subunit alpha, partial [Candidatus Binataceae bacterium]
VSRVGFSASIRAMRQVGGTLKLDLAQYREMAAFAQFASDLDASSQRLLSRGARLTEMLKQEQYSPIPVEKQVMLIFAGNQGYFDKLSLEQIKPFERGLYDFLDARHANLLDQVRTKREITDGLRNEIAAALDKYLEEFLAEHAKQEGARAA